MRPADNRGVHHARGDDADLDTAGQSTRELIVRLLHRVETLSADLHSMRAESQRLSEEISRLKSRQDHIPADPAPREAPAGTRARRDKPDTPPIDWSVARTADVPAIQPLIVYTLGRFAVYRGDTPIEDSAWQRQKAKKLFKLLLLAPQRQLLKDRVLDLLWPDKSPETAANNLHRTLFILRRVLQPDLENANQSHYLLCKDDMIALHAATIAWVDAEE